MRILSKSGTPHLTASGASIFFSTPTTRSEKARGRPALGSEGLHLREQVLSIAGLFLRPSRTPPGDEIEHIAVPKSPDLRSDGIFKTFKETPLGGPADRAPRDVAHSGDVMNEQRLLCRDDAASRCWLLVNAFG